MAGLHGDDKNPLQRGPPYEVISYAKNFHYGNNLHNIVSKSELVKGGLYIRAPQESMIYAKEFDTFKPPNFYDPELNLSLTDSDSRAIEKHQQNGRWRKWRNLSKAHILLLVTCSMGALTQGWDMSAINAATVFWPVQLEDPDRLGNPDRNRWIKGVVNAGPYISGAFFALFCACPMSVFGRRTILLVAGIVSFSASLASSFVQTWQQLLALRLLLGLSTAFESIIVPILLAETSPKQIRGMIVTSWQVFFGAGVFLGFFLNLCVSHIPSESNWRIMLGLSAIPAFLQLCSLPFCVESPRWLIKAGKISKALQALQTLHSLDSSIVACGDLLLIHAHLMDEISWIENAEKSKKASRKTNHSHTNDTEYIRGTNIMLRDLILPEPWIDEPAESAKISSSDINVVRASRLSNLPVNVPKISSATRGRVMFSTRHMRTALRASIIVMACQQLCGIYTFAFYSTTAYFNSTSKVPYSARLGASAGFGFLSLLFSLLALIAIDWEAHGMTRTGWFSRLLPERINRRTLLNISFPGIAFCLVIAIAASSSFGAQLTFFFLATVAYNIGLGPMAPLIASEVFPLINREPGMCLAIFWNFVLGSIFITVTPVAIENLPRAYLGIFVALTIVSWALCFMFVPDTQGCSLEVILAQLDATLWESVLYAWDLLRHPKTTTAREVWIIDRRERMALERQGKDTATQSLVSGSNHDLDA